jgi:hypothetical protein
VLRDAGSDKSPRMSSQPDHPVPPTCPCTLVLPLVAVDREERRYQGRTQADTRLFSVPLAVRRCVFAPTGQCLPVCGRATIGQKPCVERLARAIDESELDSAADTDFILVGALRRSVIVVHTEEVGALWIARPPAFDP